MIDSSVAGWRGQSKDEDSEGVVPDWEAVLALLGDGPSLSESNYPTQAKTALEWATPAKGCATRQQIKYLRATLSGSHSRQADQSKIDNQEHGDRHFARNLRLAGQFAANVVYLLCKCVLSVGHSPRLL